MHGEEAAADEIGLRRLAQAQRHIRLAHAEVEFVVAQDHLQLDVRIESRNCPSRGVSQLVPMPKVVVTRNSPCGFSRLSVSRICAASSLRHHILDGAQEKIALLGQDQAARMAVKQRHFEILLQRAHLPADRRLAESQDSPAWVKDPASAAA